MKPIKLLSGAMITAVAASMSLSAAYAQQTPYAEQMPYGEHYQSRIITKDIVLNPYMDAQTQMQLPQLVVAPGNTLALHLQNFSSEPLTFSAPQLSLETVVPRNTEKVVYIEPARLALLQPGEQVAYYISDDSGNQLASSTIQSQGMLAVTTLEREQAYTYQEPEPVAIQPEPEPPAPVYEQRSTVRGYW